MKMGELVRYLRSERGWTLEELSQRSGVEPGTIHALEKRASSRSQYIGQLAKAFGLDPAELMQGLEPHELAHIKPQPTPDDHHVAENRPAPWPFRSISAYEWRCLSSEQQAEVEGFVRGLLSGRRAAPRLAL